MVTLLELRIQFVFVDLDWAGDIDRRRSTIGYVFTMFGGAISWMSKQQPMVALSTIEVEYMAATHAFKEAIWLRRLCFDVGVDVGHITIWCIVRVLFALQGIQLSILE